MTLFNPQYSDFTPIQKLRNVFSEVFLVQIRRKLRKIHSEVRIQGKKNFGKLVPNFKIKGKKGNPGGKKRWDENLSLCSILGQSLFLAIV
jgi:hypothetical protein